MSEETKSGSEQAEQDQGTEAPASAPTSDAQGGGDVNVTANDGAEVEVKTEGASEESGSES